MVENPGTPQQNVLYGQVMQIALNSGGVTTADTLPPVNVDNPPGVATLQGFVVAPPGTVSGQAFGLIACRLPRIEAGRGWRE